MDLKFHMREISLIMKKYMEDVELDAMGFGKIKL